jgi:hypothetical protein
LESMAKCRLGWARGTRSLGVRVIQTKRCASSRSNERTNTSGCRAITAGKPSDSPPDRSIRHGYNPTFLGEALAVVEKDSDGKEHVREILSRVARAQLAFGGRIPSQRLARDSVRLREWPAGHEVCTDHAWLVLQP